MMNEIFAWKSEIKPLDILLFHRWEARESFTVGFGNLIAQLTSFDDIVALKWSGYVSYVRLLF